MALNEMKVGQVYASTQSPIIARADKTSAGVVTDAHGRFQEAALLGQLFSTGMTTTAITNATFTTGTLTATCTPVIGIWNPSNSGKNCVDF